MRSHAIACNLCDVDAISKKKLSVDDCENTPGTRSGTESLPEVFLHDNCEQIFIIIQAERGFAAWAVFVGRTVVFVRGKGKGA